jgi:hypothetical protein
MARIRTIKPEFWSHPVLSQSPDEVRLGAIGLLNYADDEGYFLAAPAQVRSFIWPFDEDSTKARRVLDNLSRAAYIEVREHPLQGLIGRIVNFSKHQRVDRPNPSKLKDYFQSTNVRRMIDERSLLEQGTGNREQGREEEREETPPAVPPPLALASPAAQPAPVGAAPRSGSASKPKREPKRSPEVTLAEYVAQCEERDVAPVPAGDTIFEWADSIGLPVAWLELAWFAFEQKYREGKSATKRYADWRAVFRTSLRENWLKLWWLDGEQWKLTTTGMQAQRQKQQLDAQQAAA